MIRRDQDEAYIARRAAIERVDSEQGTVYRVSISSEAPIRDWPWAPPNRLIHTERAVDLDGIAERGLPVSATHAGGRMDLRGIVARVTNVKLSNKRLVGDLKFSEANPDAAMVRGMVDEGTLTDMSVEAMPVRIKRIQGDDGDVELVEWERWRPVRVAIVDAGADQSIGIGREARDQIDRQLADLETGKQADTLSAPDRNCSPAHGAGSEAERTESNIERNTAMGTTTDADGNELSEEQEAQQRIERGQQQVDAQSAVERENKRISAIEKIGSANTISEETVKDWIKRGVSFEQIADDILEIQKRRGEAGAAATHLGLSRSEAQEYRLCRAIAAAAPGGKWDAAPFELECHNEIAERLNKVPDNSHTFYVPLDVQRRQMQTDVDLGVIAQRHGLPAQVMRDLNVGTGSAGGFTVGTSVVGFDALLRNISIVMRLGATTLSGLRDNVTIPRQTAAATADWLTSETDTIAESELTFTQLPLAPKTVGGYTELSRKLLLQSSIDIEGLVNADLAAVVALAADLAALQGSGAAGQPTGLDNVTGIGAVTGTSLDFADILEFQTDVASANVMPVRGGYATTPAVASLCIQRVKYTNTASPLWEGNLWNGSMQGFQAMSSNQVAAAVMYFGDWSKMVVAEWGVLEIDTNPYAGFTAGIIGVRAMYSMDVGVRYPAAFSRADTIT